MSNVIYDNEWISPAVHMPPPGREVLVRVERPLKSGNIDVEYGGVMRWNGCYWIDANDNKKRNVVVHKWYMFFRDTEDSQEY